MQAWLHDPWIRTIPPKAERDDPTFETLPQAQRTLDIKFLARVNFLPEICLAKDYTNWLHQLVSSSARVTPTKYQKYIGVSDKQIVDP